MSEAAANELTFLFTDIEGSTSLWEHHPEAMQAALARHDSLMRQHIRRRHGRVFKTVGDAFYAVFPNAFEALRAAIDLQHALHAADWGEISQLKVRMALHTGGAEQRSGDYFGPTLNRIARLLAVAHGGQILLSGATRQAIGNQLPDEAELRDMGQFQLRDIIRIEQIFQVLAPGLPDEFPPLHANTSTPHNLPVQVTSFIGREELISQSRRHMRQAHLLTLTGPGGTGKTRLSLQVAEQLLGRFPDGVWFVELAPLGDPSLVPQAIAQAVQLREDRDQPLIVSLGEYFRAKQMLLILDNCEHLIDACAQAAEALLRQCPQLRILATSREALNIAGETTMRIPSLQLPDGAGDDLEPLAASEAVRLLLDRVRAVQPAFALTAQNAAAIAAICRRLDGIPLALELAAARFKVLDAESIASRLDDRFKLLTSGNRTALPRQQTLRALIDWSHDLLAPAEQILLRRLAVFAGGWTLEAAENVAAGPGLERADILDNLINLVQKSLVVVEDQGGPARYRLLETIRQYGWERLAEIGENEEWVERHAEWGLAWADRADRLLRGPEQIDWLGRFDQEHDNLRAALEWGLQQPEENELTTRLCTCMTWFWTLRGHLSEGRRWLESALARPQRSQAVRARALGCAGILAFNQGDGPACGALLEESVSLYEQIDAPWHMAFALTYLGRVYQIRGESELSGPTLERAIGLFRQLGDRWGIAHALTAYGHVLRQQNNFPRARMLLDEALAIVRELGDTSGIALALNSLGYVLDRQGEYQLAVNAFLEGAEAAQKSGNHQTIGPSFNYLGEMARLRGDYAAAERHYAASLAIFREMNAPALIGMVLLNQGQLARLQGQYQRALALIKESLKIMRRVRHRRFASVAMAAIGGIAARYGDYERAVRLFGALEGMLEELERRLDTADEPLYAEDSALARAALSHAAWMAAWDAGQALGFDDAIDYALEADYAGEPQIRAEPAD